MKYAFLFFALAASLVADTVTLDNGDKLTGKVTQIYKGVLKLETAYAGAIEVAQTNVVGLSVDAPVNISEYSPVPDSIFENNDGTELHDFITSSMNLELKVAEGEIPVRNLCAFWLIDAPQPAEPVKKSSPWSFAVSAESRFVDGNSEGSATGFNAEANYVIPSSFTFKLFAGSRYTKTDGVVSENNVFGGADADFFLSEYSGVYARDELLSDDANDIQLRSTFAGGGEYFLYKNAIPGGLEMLRLRVGLGHRYEKHNGDDSSSSSDMTLDFGARFHKRLSDIFAWTTELTYTPAVKEFSDYIFTHDSHCDVDLAKDFRLSLEVGVLHTYNSVPPADNSKLDTVCFARIKKTW